MPNHVTPALSLPQTHTTHRAGPQSGGQRIANSTKWYEPGSLGPRKNDVMPNQIRSSTPEINRLRAAAALIPIIESGLLESRLSVERAALMASFCEWAVEKPSDDPEVAKLAATVGDGLKRIKSVLSAA